MEFAQKVLLVLTCSGLFVGWTSAVQCFACSKIGDGTSDCGDLLDMNASGDHVEDNCTWCQKTYVELFYTKSVIRSCEDECEEKDGPFSFGTGARVNCCNKDLCNSAPSSSLATLPTLVALGVAIYNTV